MFASPAALCLLLALVCVRYSTCAPTDGAKSCVGVTLSENQICCDEKVVNVPGRNYRCCISDNGEVTLYNTTSHFCNPSKKVKRLPSSISRTPYLLPKEKPGKPIRCQGIVYPNMSSSDAECCGDYPYLKNDESNPCLAYCGKRKYNSEYQMCCVNKIYNSMEPNMQCCNDVLINTRTHDCCNDSVQVPKNVSLFCCKDLSVYHNATMTCDEKTGKVHLRPALKFFNPADFCTFKAGWQEFTFDVSDYPGITITGLVESCGVRSRRGDLIIPLSPFSVTSNGQPVDLGGDENVFKVRVQFHKKCRVGLLKHKLTQQVLVIHTTDTSFLSIKKPQLLIKRGGKSSYFCAKQSWTPFWNSH